MKSMNKHMRKVDFKEPAETSAGSSPEGKPSGAESRKG